MMVQDRTFAESFELRKVTKRFELSRSTAFAGRMRAAPRFHTIVCLGSRVPSPRLALSALAAAGKPREMPPKASATAHKELWSSGGPKEFGEALEKYPRVIQDLENSSDRRKATGLVSLDRRVPA